MRQTTRPGTGIGRALRTARLRRGKSIEEASRETRVKAEYLNALERERYDVLLGDVYVRGFLRSYARYLGLNPEKVLAAYSRIYGRRRPAPAPVHRAPGVGVESIVDPPERHRRTAWLLAAAAATILLISAGAVGLISRSTDAPAPAPSLAPGIEVLSPKVRVDIEAKLPVGAAIIVDGDPSQGFSGVLDIGEAHSFEGERTIAVHLDSGQSVKVVVNGHDVGTPGTPGADYDHIFTENDFRGKKG
ncbi:MAG TPA: helix-turn-helix transcriptional regulator [Actinomycetota bacterium]|jgi:hypothetical protein|nr:helix-turn-helix transcriptional regulator [Actinomycetota bacterium]